MPYRHVHILLLSLLLCATTGYGQSTEEAHHAPNRIDTIDLENIVIASTRALDQDPVTIQNIEIKDIENIYIGQDPAVLLSQLSPSIISYSDAGTDIGNYAQFRMRGMSQSRINITLNGVPLNDMIDHGVYFSNFSDFGNSVQSIQIQRGTGTSNNGVSSYGGSINFESSNLFVPAPSAELQLTTGSFGTLRASGELFTGTLKNNTAFYSRYTRTATQGYKDHSASDAASFFFSGGYLGDTDMFKITAFAGKTQNDQSYLPVLRSSIDINPKINYNYPNDTDDFEQDMVQLQYSRINSELVTTNYTLYYAGARGVFPFSIDYATQYMFGINNNRYGFISHITMEPSGWNIKSGLHGYTMRRINTEYLAPSVSNPYLKEWTDKIEGSWYFKINRSINNWNIYGDGQLRYVNMSFYPDPTIGTGLTHERDWLFLNATTGIKYHYSRSGFLYFSFGRTGREPTRSDIFGGTEEEVLNNTVQQEYVNDLEIGWQATRSKAQIKTNIFLMSFENEISKIGALQERSYMEVTQNVKQSIRYGVEIQGKYTLSKLSNVNFNLAYLKTNVKEYTNSDATYNNVEQIFSPHWNITTMYEQKIGQKLNLQISSRYNSRSYMELSNDPSFLLPSYIIFNGQIGYQYNQRAHISLSINNITNQLYYTDGAPVDLDYDGIVEGPGYRVQPPRNVYLVFKINL